MVPPHMGARKEGGTPHAHNPSTPIFGVEEHRSDASTSDVRVQGHVIAPTEKEGRLHKGKRRSLCAALNPCAHDSSIMLQTAV